MHACGVTNTGLLHTCLHVDLDCWLSSCLLYSACLPVIAGVFTMDPGPSVCAPHLASWITLVSGLMPGMSRKPLLRGLHVSTDGAQSGVSAELSRAISRPHRRVMHPPCLAAMPCVHRLRTRRAAMSKNLPEISRPHTPYRAQCPPPGTASTGQKAPGSSRPQGAPGHCRRRSRTHRALPL